MVSFHHQIIAYFKSGVRRRLTGPAFAAGLTALLLSPSGPAHAVCAVVTVGQVVSCTGATAGSQSFTATAQPWTYTLTDSGGTFGTTITGTSGSSTTVGVVGINNNGDFNGTVTVNTNTAIVNNATGARPGLVIENNTPNDSTVAVEVDGKIQTNDGNADALRLVNGFNYAVTIGASGLIHGGDDGMVVTAATGLVTITNNGTVEVTGTSGSATNLSDGVLIAQGGTPGTHISGAATVTNAGTVSGFTSGDPANGGSGLSVSANGAITIINTSDGTLDAAAAGGNYGIFAHGSSTINITNAGDIGVTGGEITVSGISATNTTGALTITNTGEIGATENRIAGTGMNAVSTSGTVTVSNNSNSIWSIDDGIRAVSAGNVIINNGEGTTPSPDGLIDSSSGNGIRAQSTGGSVTVNTGANSGINAALSGVSVEAATSATINNLGSIEGGTGTSGDPVIYSSATNGLTLNNCTQVLFDLDGCAGAVIQSSLGSPTDDVVLLAEGGALAGTTINNFGKINGRMDLSGGGAVVFNNYSSNSWNTSGITNFSNDADLIENNGGALNTTGPSTTINFLDGNDHLLNRNGGTIDASGFTSFRFGRGEDTLTNTGGSSSITANGSTMFVFDHANYFLGFPTSNSGAQSNDQFTNTRGAEFDVSGITTFWFGGGDDTFENSRGAEFHADGITTINLGSGDDTLRNERGGLFDAFGVTTLTFGSGADTLINQRGGEFYVGGVSATITGIETLTNTERGEFGLFALANTVTGLTTLTNDRGSDFVVEGLINTFSFGSGGDVFNNERGSYFEVNSLTTFLMSGGDDTFNNRRGGRFVSSGLTNFAFGGGANDTVNNTSGGRISVEGEMIFTGLEFFNNGSGGGSGRLVMENGHAGDVIVMAPSDGEALIFHGAEGRSHLSIDAFLAGPGEDFADLLIVQGTVTGKTQLHVANVNELPAFLDLEGVKVVQASASSGDGSEFFLDGPVEAGLFDYGLFFDDAGETDDWYLRSAVNGNGQALGSLHTGIASLFTTGAGPWTERAADLHDTVLSGHGPVSAPLASGPNGGIWGAMFGGTRTHDATFTTMIDTYDASYRQNALGFLGGIDSVVDTNGEGTLLAGVAGGYLTSSLAFASEGARGNMRGGSVGGYLSYVKSGFFADLLVKADFLSVEFAAGGSTANSTGRAIGALADVGHRMDSGDMFLEPIATLSYVNVSTGGFELLGTDIIFPNSNNLLGRLGARAGTSAFSDGEARVDTFVSASVWKNFTGGNTATIVGGGGEVTVVNAGSGLYFEVGAGVELVSLTNGMTGFVRGDYQFGDSISGGSGRGGVRVNW